MIFETSRLLVRQYMMDDFENFYLLNSDEEVMRYIRPVKSKADTFAFFLENVEYYENSPHYGRWAMLAKRDERFIGSFMMRPSAVIEGNIELGYAMLKNFWGMGFATESVNGGLDYAFNKLQLQTVIAIAQLENAASQKVLLKCGFAQQDNIKDRGKVVNLFRKLNPTHG
jgi:ribosomal-protein-alanine N-acetyltransferase